MWHLVVPSGGIAQPTGASGALGLCQYVNTKTVIKNLPAPRLGPYFASVYKAASSLPEYRIGGLRLTICGFLLADAHFYHKPIYIYDLYRLRILDDHSETLHKEGPREAADERVFAISIDGAGRRA